MPWFSVPRIPRGPCRGRRLGEARKHITRGSVPRPMPSDVRGELSYLEKKVLLALKDLGKASPDEVQARGRFGELVEVMNAASWLQAKGLLTMRERVERSYRLARGDLARRLLPERKALKALLRAKGRLPAPRPSRAPRPPTPPRLKEKELAIALGWLRRKGWAVVEKGPAGSTLVVTDAGRAAADTKGPDEALLARPGKAEVPEADIDPALLRDLTSRQELVREREAVRRELALTERGAMVVAAGLDLKEEVARPTTALLRSRRWEHGEVGP